MQSVDPYLLQISGVVKGPVAESFRCRTVDSVIELCKKTGTFLWANSKEKIRIAGMAGTGDDPVLMLTKASPIREDIALWDGPNEGMAPVESGIFVDQVVFDAMNKRIDSDVDPVRRVSTWPIDRTFVYIDVSDFSKEKPGKQAMIINSIVVAVDNELNWPGQFSKFRKEFMEARICIGDGYIFVFKDAENAVIFGAYLSFLIEFLIAKKRIPVDFHFRIGVHVGEVFCFWDPGRDDWNYIGDGINGGQRVLAAIGKDTDDVMFLSGQVRRRLAADAKQGDSLSSLLAALHNRGRRADKHGHFWRVYEMNHTDFISPFFERAAIQ